MQEACADCAVVDLGLPRLQDGLEAIRDFKTVCPNLGVYVLTGTRESALSKLDLVDETFTKGGPVLPLIAALKKRYYDV